MRSNVRELTHILLVNTSSSHLHICATLVSSGLATRATSHECHRGRWERLLHVGGPASVSFSKLFTFVLRFKCKTVVMGQLTLRERKLQSHTPVSLFRELRVEHERGEECSP
jgi:hypothetical protein